MTTPKFRKPTSEELATMNKIASGTYKYTGLGDVVAAATKLIRIEPCEGCKKRQAWLNEKFPFKKREK